MKHAFGYQQLDVDIEMGVQKLSEKTVATLNELPQLHFTRPTLFFSHSLTQDRQFVTSCSYSSTQQFGEFNLLELLLVLSSTIVSILISRNCIIKSLSLQAKCTIDVELLSLSSAVLLIVPPLSLCSQTFKANLNMIIFLSILWIIISFASFVSSFTQVILFQIIQQDQQSFCQQETKLIRLNVDYQLYSSSIICLLQGIYLIALYLKTSKWISQGKKNKIHLGLNVLNTNLPIIYD